MAENITDFRRLFIEDVPLMDVRAPVEFIKGAFPLAVNHPLMNDAERQQVGTCYKQKGQAAAIALGHKLVSGATKNERIEAWRGYATQNPHGVLYCFRGGLRSKISQEWLCKEADIDYPRIEGGYKAMRQFLIDVLHQALDKNHFYVVGGLTGCGKTEVLTQLGNSLDLEAYAHHRGSSFGKRPHQQPSQIDFEHRLCIDILKKENQGVSQFVLEDEGRFIGSCALPIELHQHMQNYPMVWLNDSTANRSQRILETYVIEQKAEYASIFGEEIGFNKFAEGLTTSLTNIRKRLGDELYQRLFQAMTIALEKQQQSGCVELHLHWIGSLLSNYFDPMYQYQRKQKSDRIHFEGNQTEVIEFLRTPISK